MRRLSECCGTKTEMVKEFGGKVRSGGGRGGVVRDVCGFLLGFSSFFCFSQREGFSERKKAKKNEKSTRIVLCP